MLTLNMQKIISIVNSGYNIGAGKRKRMREGEEERGEWGGGGGGGGVGNSVVEVMIAGYNQPK
jgi:hypothetical protein